MGYLVPYLNSDKTFTRKIIMSDTATPPVKRPVLLYTEQTPNPETLKYVTNRMLFKGTAEFKDRDLAKEWSPLAAALYEFPYVKNVYIANNYVTITKEFNYAWEDIMIKLKEYIKDYLSTNDGDQIVKEGFTEVMAKAEAERVAEEYSGDDAELVRQIKELIDT
ncbi:MAG: NifU N-terminal domain-containing protein, partial [Bacteroidota bacterium]